MFAFLLLLLEPAHALPAIHRADTLATELATDDSGAALTAERQMAPEPPPEAMPLRLRADRQRYTEDTFEAEGNVELAFGAATLRADRLSVDLQAQTVTATGNIEIELGRQRLQGDRLDYDLKSETGELLKARGLLDIENVDTLNLAGTTTPEANLVRFTAERIALTSAGWVGETVRITNDPLDPPELEIEAERTTVTILPSGESVAIATGANLVFDQRFRLPSFVNRLRLDTLGRRPPITIDFDNRDGGLQVQQNFELLEEPRFSLVLSPKLIPQRLIADPDGILAGLGVDLEFQVRHLNNHISRLFIEVNGLIINQLDERTRGVLSHQIPLGRGNLSLSYRYRQRFGTEFTGTQTVRHMTGVSYDSPRWELGSSEIFASVNASADWITARGEQFITASPTAALADASPEISLGRLRLDASLSRRIPLWLGNVVDDLSLLRFSSEPVQPGVWLNAGVTASHAGYTDGKTQSYLLGSIGVETVLGNFIDDSFDFTQFQVTYSNGFLSGASPFFFDRLTASERLRVGILQQLYGPIRIGAETVIDLNTRRQLDTTYSLSYDRRTYGVLLRYNPVQEAGSVQLRVSDFNWVDTEGISRGSGSDVN